MYTLRGPEPINYSNRILYKKNIVVFVLRVISKHPSNIKKACIFNYISASLWTNTRWQNYLSQRGHRRAAVNCTTSCFKGSLVPEVADISLVRGDSRNAQSGRAAISYCFTRSGRSSISSTSVLQLGGKQHGRNGCKQHVLWLFKNSFIFSVIHRHDDLYHLSSFPLLHPVSLSFSYLPYLLWHSPPTCI